MTRFAESFWNSEFCNFTGFDILCKRMKDGKQMTKDYADFLKLRAQAEESYGKALMKIAKMIGGKDEIGTLRQSWEVLRIQTENIGQAHISTANLLTEEMNKVLEFLDSQREQRRKVEEGVRRTQANIKVLYKKVIECKKAYEIRCREADQVVQAFNAEISKANAQVKDLEKLKQKQIKTTQIAEQADASYKSTVETLDQSRMQWEQETETACNIFQQLEEERIQYIRNSLWTATNLGSAVCVAEDEMQEEIRKMLEKCDVDADIQLFILQKRTSSERPASIEYENYFGGQTEKNGNQISNKNMKNCSPDTVIPSLPKMNSMPAKPVVLNSAKSDSLESIENAAYESHVSLTPINKKILCRVMYDFDGRNDEELTLREDDIVTLIHKENADWWEVETSTGTKGYYPATYLEIA